MAKREKKKRRKGTEAINDKSGTLHTSERQLGKESQGKESKTEKEKPQDWIMKTVGVVIEHLNRFGACVIDDFLGEAKGVDILEEVFTLQKLEKFQVI